MLLFSIGIIFIFLQDIIAYVYVVERPLCAFNQVLRYFFCQSLYAQGFLEIIMPKPIADLSEGGADVYHADYFGFSVCLAHSF